MKVTEEMLTAFNDADFSGCGNADWEDSHIRVGLQAVLDLIQKEQHGFGVQSDRDDTVPELVCLIDDDCLWGAEVRQPEGVWTTIADLAQVAAEHAAGAHR